MTLAAKMNKLVPITAEYAIWTPVNRLAHIFQYYNLTERNKFIVPTQSKVPAVSN